MACIHMLLLLVLCPLSIQHRHPTTGRRLGNNPHPLTPTVPMSYPSKRWYYRRLWAKSSVPSYVLPLPRYWSHNQIGTLCFRAGD